MGSALFYHLTRSSAESVLAMIIARSLDQGWRVAVRAVAQERIARLDEKLWLEPEDGFLPHGLAGAPHEADQPVLLTTGAAGNGWSCLVLIDGAQAATDEAAGAERLCILFDGNDPGAVEEARGQWRSLTASGIAAQYWSEETGRWQKKAESPAR